MKNYRLFIKSRRSGERGPRRVRAVDARYVFGHLDAERVPRPILVERGPVRLVVRLRDVRGRVPDEARRVPPGVDAVLEDLSPRRLVGRAEAVLHVPRPFERRVPGEVRVAEYVDVGVQRPKTAFVCCFAEASESLVTFPSETKSAPIRNEQQLAPALKVVVALPTHRSRGGTPPGP